MDWLGPALEQYGLLGVIVLLFVFSLWWLVRSNANTLKASGEQSKMAGVQVNTALELVGTFQQMVQETLTAIRDHTAAVEKAVVLMADTNEKQWVALGAQISEAATGASIERTAHSKHFDEQIARVISQLETIQAAIDSSVRGDELRAMFVETKTLLIEIKSAVEKSA